MATWTVLKKLYDLLNAAGTSIPTFINYIMYAAANKTPVVQSASAESGTVNIHSVTGGKTFFMTTLSMSSYNSTGTPTVTAASTDMAGWDDLMVHQVPVSGNIVHTTINYSMPLKITTGKVVKINSPISGAYVYAQITGWEE